MEKYGIENLKKFMALIIEMGNVADQMGRLKGMARYMFITQLFDEMTMMATFSYDQMKKEFEDLSPEEMAELEKFLIGKFNIEKDDLEAVIEKSFVIGLKVFGLIDELNELIRGEKEQETI